MKRELYFWLMQLAYNMIMHYNKKFKKWCDKYEEWTEKYHTGGSDNAETN